MRITIALKSRSTSQHGNPQVDFMLQYGLFMAKCMRAYLSEDGKQVTEEVFLT